jgi:hypothetical protein
MLRSWALAGTLALALPFAAFANEPKGELAPPIRIMAGERPIAVDSPGHSAPFFGDLCGDGKRCLLVGQFKDGLLRIYRNVGTETAPQFEKFELLLEGKSEGRVPTG